MDPMVSKFLVACALTSSLVGSAYWGSRHQGNSNRSGDIGSEGGTLPSPTSTPVATAFPSPMLSSPSPTPIEHSQLKWGAYVGWQEGSLAAFEATVGEKVDMVSDFVHWGNEKDFPSHYGASVRDQGKTLVIYWEAKDYNHVGPNDPRFNYDAINEGKWDPYITEFAEAAKEYGGPVILLPFNEMNDNVAPWAGTVNNNSAAKHIQAFRRLREMFRTATNVKFGWAVNSMSVPTEPGNLIEDYYPGDEYVDYVGVDGFNFGEPWRSFEEVMGPALITLARYPKPIYIFSMGSRQGAGKAEWIKEGLGDSISKYPNVVGWIWFNEDKAENGEHDWRINSDPASLEAFKSIIP